MRLVRNVISLFLVCAAALAKQAAQRGIELSDTEVDGKIRSAFVRAVKPRA
jgi:urease gamma subunit